MLDALTATRFHRRMTRGRTGPFLLEGENGAGDTVEVIAKFTSAQLPVEGLVREAFGALLAADLGLPVPECYCVTVQPDFVAAVTSSHPAEGAALAAAIPIGFGSVKLPPGFVAWMPERPLPKAMRHTAAEIYAFDLLIQNPDRRPGNPNLQSKGDDFAIFDHEMALVTEGVLFWHPPWEAGRWMPWGRRRSMSSTRPCAGTSPTSPDWSPPGRPSTLPGWQPIGQRSRSNGLPPRTWRTLRTPPSTSCATFATIFAPPCGRS